MLNLQGDALLGIRPVLALWGWHVASLSTCLWPRGGAGPGGLRPLEPEVLRRTAGSDEGRDLQGRRASPQPVVSQRQLLHVAERREDYGILDAVAQVSGLVAK